MPAAAAAGSLPAGLAVGSSTGTGAASVAGEEVAGLAEEGGCGWEAAAWDGAAAGLGLADGLASAVVAAVPVPVPVPGGADEAACRLGGSAGVSSQKKSFTPPTPRSAEPTTTARISPIPDDFGPVCTVGRPAAIDGDVAAAGGRTGAAMGRGGEAGRGAACGMASGTRTGAGTVMADGMGN